MKLFRFTLILSCLLLCSCSRFFYYPAKEKFYDPTKLDVKPTSHYIDVEKDVRLHLWHFQNEAKKPPKAIIVFFHGNAQNLTSHFGTLYWILKFNYDYLIFDYRGYGESTGNPSPEGTVNDGKSVLRWVQKKFPQTPIVVFGQSLGGIIALKTSAEMKKEIPLEAIVADSTFASYQGVGANILSKSWFTWLFQPLAYVLLSDKWAPKKDIEKLSPIPLLVIHGKTDETVDFSFGKKIFDLAKEPKEFWQISNGQHTDSFWRHDGRYRGIFLEYLDKILSSRKTIHP